MSDLRWALIAFGLPLLLGLVLWEWRRSRQRPGRTRLVEPRAPDITLIGERPRRMEPGLGDVSGMLADVEIGELEVPTIMPLESVPVAAELAVDVPAAARGASGDPLFAPVHASARSEPAAQRPAVAISWPPLKADKVLTLRVVKPDGAAMPGRTLRSALEAAGLVSGPQDIFHRPDAHGAVIVSAANLTHPGTLDPSHMDATEYRGLSLFSVLPGPLPPARMLAELVTTARALAQRLGAVVQDERGADLDGTRLAELRRELPEGNATTSGAP